MIVQYWDTNNLIKMAIITYLLLFSFFYHCDGKFSSWNEWSTCSVKCGKGVISRERILNTAAKDSCYSAIIEKKDCNENCQLKNINLKSASASSQFLKAFPASRAIDGGISTNLYAKSCMHTAKDQHPWLRVELKHIGLVKQVVIYNRADCCSDRLNNVLVTVGYNADGSGNQICGRKENMSDVDVFKMHCCKPIVGKYVHLTIPGPQFLHVCEIQVLGNESMNLAFGKTAVQSSTHSSPHAASVANDGKFDRYTQSLQEKNPWWRVDLGHTAVVAEVIIHGFDRYGNYIQDANVTSTDKDGNKIGVCGVPDASNIVSSTSYNVYRVICPTGLKGRFVQLQLFTSNGYLTLREVEVFGL